MIEGLVSRARGALTGSKGVVLAGVAALAAVSLAGLVNQGSQTALAQTVMPQQAPAAKSSFSPEQVQELQGIIREYLMAHPEVLADVSQALERKQAAEQQAKAEKYLLENKLKVFTSGGDVVLGNPKGDVTVVEFFDYNCGWCKRALDDVQKLIKADPRVRVVLKEYPIFGGPPSVLAARAAMASVKQNKYWEFHTALMREKQVTEQNLFVVAQRVGLDVARLKADMADKKVESVIQENIEIGQGLGIEGTPGFVIDSHVNVGYVPADGIQKMLGEIRKVGCKMC